MSKSDPDFKDVEEILTKFFSNTDNQDFKKREAVKVIADNTFKKNYQGTTRETVPYNVGLAAYKYILDNGGTPREALEYSVTVHDKSLEWLDSIKHNPYYHSKEAVKAHDNHPAQKTMVKNGTMDKSALKSSNTVNQQITRLSRYKKVSDKLEGLEERVGGLEDEVDTHSKEIDRLKRHAGIEEIPKKDVGYQMYQHKMTQKKVSEELGVSIATVKRWWREYKECDKEY